MTSRLRRLFLGSAAALALGAGALAIHQSPGLSSAFAQAQSPAAIAAPLSASAAPMSFADVVERVRPAVVSVRVTRAAGETMALDDEGPGGPQGPMERFFRRFGGEGERFGPRQPPRRGAAQGSGFFISADGFAVTNNHVVEGAGEVELVLDGGRTVRARVVGTDPRTDLALLKAEGRDFPFVSFAPQAPRVGDWVIAVGNPFGLGGTVTAGIVSARGRDIGSGPYDDFLQIDAPINRGNSGGPTFNVHGQVIGVNTAIFSPSGGNVGIAFAIPSETSQAVVAALRETGQVARGWIGVQIQPLTPEIAESLGVTKPEGALVAAIQPGSPAARAALQPSDVIVAVDGRPVTDPRELTRRIGAMRPGSTVNLTVMREGRERPVELTLGELPGLERRAAATPGREDRRGDGAMPIPRLGLSLAPAARVQGAGRDGVVVTEVDPNGPAGQRGLRAGDVILDVGGRPVSTPGELRDALGQARADGRRSALLRIRSGDATRLIALPFAG